MHDRSHKPQPARPATAGRLARAAAETWIGCSSRTSSRWCRSSSRSWTGGSTLHTRVALRWSTRRRRPRRQAI
ncbi:hypothetical protein Zm00014a_038413 [Zea mays]|uniref:Uncharacterized protein n=2 Tax=Zea mays TaxID=4577 RepID=A0A3L6DAH0_MAIZE|nr:hypothetical protein Zm00014a_038413 [Zea mays]PWZ04631.1 hypothetical protein Zm00014a_038413 [Zea mays]